VNQSSASENYQLGNPKASYGPNRESTILLLIAISACAVGGLVLLVVGLGQDYIRDKAILSGGGLLMLLIGLGLHTVYRGLLRTGVEVYDAGFVLTDRRNQRHVCRWDDVTEVYETLIQRDPARHGMGTAGGEYTVHRAEGQPIKFGVSVQNSKNLGLIIQARVKERLLPQATETYKAGGTVAFGPQLSLSRQGITSGQETLPWNQVAEIRLRMGARIKQKGKRRPWKSIGHSRIANYPVLRDLVRMIHLKPHDGQPAGSLKDISNPGTGSPGVGLGASGARQGFDVRELLREGYDMRDIRGFLKGEYDIHELRRRKLSRATKKRS